jgi:uncharacterized protein YcfJ
MKKLLAIVLIAAMGGTPVLAGSGAVLGALLGAGAGVAIGEHSKHFRTEIAVPVLAVAGGLIGNYIEDQHRDHNRQYVAQAAVGQVLPAPNAVAVPDLHPGIDLVKVSVALRNGTRVDIPVIRVGERYIGPQGEEYDGLPTAATLGERYAR